MGFRYRTIKILFNEISLRVTRVSEEGLVFYDEESDNDHRAKEKIFRLNDYLNDQGNMGWELINITDSVFIFKK